MLRLTLLAPGIVEAVLEGRQPEGITLEWVVGTLPVVWEEQERTL